MYACTPVYMYVKANMCMRLCGMSVCVCASRERERGEKREERREQSVCVSVPWDVDGRAVGGKSEDHGR